MTQTNNWAITARSSSSIPCRSDRFFPGTVPGERESYEKIELVNQERKEEMIRDLSERTGLVVHDFEIVKIIPEGHCGCKGPLLLSEIASFSSVASPDTAVRFHTGICQERSSIPRANVFAF
ncbi:MAG: hypothetical protein PHH09_10680 [Methanoregulaceae archaeon]|nr:hypothetical protein [Methanoregulaceae archaeon]